MNTACFRHVASQAFRSAFCFSLTLFLLVWSLASPCRATSDPPTYVGSEACKPCHHQEYANFMTYAKKSRSFEGIVKLQKGLEPEDLKKCYACHTTGYGKPGGFISPEKTPQLKNAGCEVCHGPGERHVVTRSPADILNHLTTEDCEICHTSERVKAFRYKPLIHGGAH